MKMYRQQVYTGQRPTTQPSLCSVLSKKLWPPKDQEKGKAGTSSYSGTGKGTTDNSVNKKKERKDGTDDLKHVLKKLKRTTPLLPKALLSPYAYEKGKKGCETCSMSKETYKSLMKSVKVIELIVDGVISKEQKEMLDKVDENQGVNKLSEQESTKDEKKISIKFEVYCQRNIDHNLKCVLIKLQNTIGDTLLQVCYCKTKNNPDNKKSKQYDVSTTDLEQLKFEYSNLTNKIIMLFKSSSSKNTVSPQVCVGCIKEEVTDYTKILQEMLKNGRNLKVTMRNEDTGEKCCSRAYPHVHAIVQGRHVVLKFELPFEVTQPPPKSNESPKRESPPINEDWQNDESSTKETTPYNEWPTYSSPKPSKEVNGGSQERPSKVNTSDTGKEMPPLGKNSLLEKEASESSKSVKSLERDSNLAPDLQEKGSPSRIPSLLMSKKSSISTVSTPPPSRISKTKSSIPSIISRDESTNSKTKDPGYIDSEMYCGCNFNLVYEKLNVDQYKNAVADVQNQELGSSLDESDSFSSQDESDSESEVRKRKQVSFIPEEKQAVLFVQDTPPMSVFKKVFDDCDHPPKSSKIEKGWDNPLPHANFVNLVGNKYSFVEKSKIVKDCNESDIVENHFTVVPQYEIKGSLTTGSKMTDQQIKSSSSLNKQQVSEVMKDLGATKLLSVSFPAECCKNNKHVKDFKCTSDLPFSASLHSLPLDQDDLNHITQVVEKLISDERILVNPDCDEEWEIQYVEEPEGVENKSFMAKDTVSNICIEIQSGKTPTKRKISKNSQKDVINLPTINEEKVSFDQKSITGSLPEVKEEKKDVMNKKRSSSKFRTLELRYLTVEYPHTDEKKTSERDYFCKKAKLNEGPGLHSHDNKPLDSCFRTNINLDNTNSATRVDIGYICDDYFNFSSSEIETSIRPTELSKNGQPLKRCMPNENPSLSPVEEMIMLDIIYLTSYTKGNDIFTAINPSNDIFISGGNNLKLSKPTSSCDFCNEIRKEIMMSSNLTMQIKNSEEKKDFPGEIEQTFRESFNLVKSCEISEKVKELLNNTNDVKTRFCKKKGIFNSRNQDDMSLSSECVRLKTKTNFSYAQVLPSINNNEEIIVKSSTFNCNKMHVKNNVNLDHRSLKHRKYFIYKKSRSKTVKDLNPLNTDTSRESRRFRRKPSILKNTAIGFKLVECKNITPVMKFPKITKITSHFEIPQLIISPKNQELVNIAENYGLMRSYTNVHKLKSESCPTNYQSLSKRHILKDKIKKTDKNRNLAIDIKHVPSRLSNYVAGPLGIDNKDDNLSFDYTGNLFYSFDVNDLPQAGTAEKQLNTVNNKMSLELGKADLPLRDFKNCPTLELSGKFISENKFSSLKPQFTKIVEDLSISGDSMDLCEGQPLKNRSDTMLMDFRCNGPLFNSRKGIL